MPWVQGWMLFLPVLCTGHSPSCAGSSHWTVLLWSALGCVLIHLSLQVMLVFKSVVQRMPPHQTKLPLAPRLLYTHESSLQVLIPHLPAGSGI